MEIWICGQRTGEWIGRGTTWEFQGVFKTEAGADSACRDESYFIFPATMDEELPHEAIDAPPRSRYPRVPNAEVGADCRDDMDKTMTASESVFGFAAWLTTRDEAVTMGATHDAAIAAELVKQWVDTNGLEDPRNGVYPDNIVMPTV